MTFTRNATEMTNSYTSEMKQDSKATILHSTAANIQAQKKNANHVPNTSRFQLCKTSCCIIFGSFALLMGMLSFKYTLFELFMAERLRMTPGLPPFEWWLNPKPEILCRAYVFTVTNADEFLRGVDTKLKIKEFGPIIYREKITHSNVEFHRNSTMSYTIKREVEFVPEMNEPGILNTTITVPNIVLLGMTTVANTYPISVKFAFNMISKNDPVFINTTVYKYLWELSTPALEVVKKYVPFMVPQDNGGVIYNVYSEFEDRINVKIGEEHGPSQFFLINTFNGRSTVPGFRPERGDCYASIANSTEGAVYPNYITKDTVIYYWRKTVCRAVPLFFEEEVQKGCLNAYKFIAKTSLYDRFDDINEDCYKGMGDTVLPNGLSDVSKCYHDLPVAVSSPHFYGRSGFWEDKLEGFSPSKEKHGSYAILEPIIGVPLEQVARSQSNMIMPKLRNFNSNISKFSEMIIPMFWMEYKQEKLTGEITAMVIFTVNILPYVQYVISVIIVLTGLFYFYVGVSRVKTVFRHRKLTHSELLDIKKDNKCYISS